LSGEIQEKVMRTRYCWRDKMDVPLLEGAVGFKILEKVK